MNERMTKGEIDRLGDRLRGETPITEEDLVALQTLRSQHADALDSAAETVRCLQLRPTTRLKTVNTLIEKLQRQSSMRLSRMQDVAGMRVVVPGTRDDQDRVVEQICRQFENPKVVDRRTKPSYGYRAVHVIVQVQGCSVEIQVRTELQDRWAQLAERLGDSWGRQVRYGEPPNELHKLLGADVTREKVWKLVLELSALIDDVEQTDVRLAAVDQQVDGSQNLSDQEDGAVLDQGFALRDRAAALSNRMMDALTQILDLESQADAEPG